MVKYIFYMLLGLFLISKVVSASGDIKECKVLHTMDARHAPEKRYIRSEWDFKQYASGVQHESYHDKADHASIGNNFSFRCTSPSKRLRNHTASITARIVRSLKTLLPEEKMTSFSFGINSFNFSYRYYVYTLRRILI